MFARSIVAHGRSNIDAKNYFPKDVIFVDTLVDD